MGATLPSTPSLPSPPLPSLSLSRWLALSLSLARSLALSTDMRLRRFSASREKWKSVKTARPLGTSASGRVYGCRCESVRRRGEERRVRLRARETDTEKGQRREEEEGGRGVGKEEERWTGAAGCKCTCTCTCRHSGEEATSRVEGLDLTLHVCCCGTPMHRVPFKNTYRAMWIMQGAIWAHRRPAHHENLA